MMPRIARRYCQGQGMLFTNRPEKLNITGHTKASNLPFMSLDNPLHPCSTGNVITMPLMSEDGPAHVRLRFCHLARDNIPG